MNNNLLSTVQSRVDALPHQQGVMWRLVSWHGERCEGGGVLDGDAVLAQGKEDTMDIVQVSAVGAQG